MRCTSCGQENPHNAKFCLECAAPFPRSCADCGTELPPQARFCVECAAPVERPSPLQERKPRDYTPKHLADRILQSKSALEGERKQVTVLFADVKGSLELAEQVDPEEWHGILDRFFQILADGVHRFEGTVNQYTGDGIMALFGAPIAHEDHAQRACYAALHLRDELRRYADELRLERGLNFSVRMGINCGEVVVGKIGDDLRMDYTARGHTVGLAARMEQLAEPGKVLLTQEVAKRVEGFFQLRDLGRASVKGIEKRVHIFELEAAGRLRTRFDVSRARGLSKFVGRSDEMAALEATLVRAESGHGQVVGVVGEAGAGKSRLCFEFLERCRTRGLHIYEAHGVAHGKGIPFLPILELFRSFFGIGEEDTSEAAREKIAGRLLLLGESYREALPLVFEFLGVADPDQPTDRMEPEARQRRLHSVVKQVLHARGQRATAITLLEDLHWFDGGSEAFLGAIVEAVAGTRGLWLLSFRPEYHAGWMKKSYYQQLPLVPLLPEATGELLRDLLGDDPTLVELPELIQARSGGNPFFIEEVVRSLVETGHLDGAKGCYRLRTPLQELGVPDTVRAVLAARIDRLPEREKGLLQTAAVIGRQFPEPILEAVSGLSVTDLAEALAALESAEFVYEHALYPVAEYVFKHALTQEVAYESQLCERRRQLHADVAKAIEAGHSEDLDEAAPLLAHHWEQAEEPMTAARWHARSARWAGVSAPAEALRHWRRVRSLLGQEPATAESLELAIECRICILDLGYRTGLPDEEAREILAEGRTMASNAENARAEVLLLAAYGVVRWLSGDPKGALAPTEQAVALAEAAGDPEARFAAAIALFQLCRQLGLAQRALDLSDECIAWSDQNPEVEQSLIGLDVTWMWARRASILGDLGRIPEALAWLRRSEELARTRGRLETVNWNQYVFVELGALSGSFADAQARANRFVEYAHERGSAFDLVLSSYTSGTALLLDGEAEQAAGVLNRGLESSRRDSVGLSVEGILLARLAQAQLQAGELEKAQAAAREAIRASRQRGTRVYECCGYLALARVLLKARGAAARADIDAALSDCLSLIEETGVRCYEPCVHEERARLAQLLGDDASAERELREAHRLYTGIGATGHAERLAKELNP
jgi:class 3 adenylate cyclase/tetratricopeptide (TPR) repeat protein